VLQSRPTLCPSKTLLKYDDLLVEADKKSEETSETLEDKHEVSDTDDVAAVTTSVVEASDMETQETVDNTEEMGEEKTPEQAPTESADEDKDAHIELENLTEFIGVKQNETGKLQERLFVFQDNDYAKRTGKPQGCMYYPTPVHKSANDEKKVMTSWAYVSVEHCSITCGNCKGKGEIKTGIFRTPRECPMCKGQKVITAIIDGEPTGEEYMKKKFADYREQHGITKYSRLIKISGRKDTGKRDKDRMFIWVSPTEAEKIKNTFDLMKIAREERAKQAAKLMTRLGNEL